MHVRSAELNDLEAVLAGVLDLAREQTDFGSRLDDDASEPVLRDRLANRILDGGVVVAEDAGDIVGIATYYQTSDGLVRVDAVGVVEYLYVSPAHRGAGIGTALLDRVEVQLAGRGVEVVELEVLAENEEAMAFYQERGYHPHRHRVAKRIDTDRSEQSE